MKFAIPRRAVLIAATAPVAAVAAMASYDHIHSLAAAHGQPEHIAATLPLAVDGMILVGSLALTDGRTERGIAWATFAAGVAFSLAANVLVATPDLLSRIVSAFPSLALLLTVEVLIRSSRRTRADMAVEVLREAAAADAIEALVARMEVEMPAEAHALAAMLSANDAEDAPGGVLPEGMFWVAIQDAEPLQAPGDERPTVDVGSSQTAGPREPRASAEELRAKVRALLEEYPQMSDAELAEQINRGVRTATRYRLEVQGERTETVDASASAESQDELKV